LIILEIGLAPNFDDIRAQAGQRLGTSGAREYAGEVEDADAG